MACCWAPASLWKARTETEPCKGTHEVGGGQDARSMASSPLDVVHIPGQGLILSASSTERGDPNPRVCMDEDSRHAGKSLELMQQVNAGKKIYKHP